MLAQRLYYWQALTPEGVLTAGETLSADRQQVYHQLMAQGYQPLRVKFGQILTRGYWKTPALIALFKQLADLLQAGLPLLDALRLIAEPHEQPGWRCLLNHIADRIAAGEAFSEVLRHFPHVFPPLYATLVAVGELTGKLEECCQQLAQQQHQQYQLQQKVKKALRYPGFVLGTAMLVSLIMLTWVLPEFATLYASFDTPLPWLTQQVITLSHRASDNLLILLAFPTIIGGFYPVCRRRSFTLLYREQTLLLKIPLIAALLRGRSLSHLFTLLALTQRAGLTLPAGLAAAATLPCPVYQTALRPIMRHIQQGTSIQHALQPYAALFPPPCMQLIRMGEETGSLDRVFSQLADWHGRQTARRADKLAETVEPLIMLLVGGIIGTLVIAMYLPIFQLGNVMAGA